MTAAPHPRRFTRSEYYAMGEAGILGPEERTELLNGEIIVMPPIGPSHADGVWKAGHTLDRRLGDRCVARGQNPIVLDDESEPQPDIALVRFREGGYAQAHPTAADVLLVIEVADNTLRFDRKRKLPRYAAAGIPEAWLMNLPADRIAVHRDPTPTGYRTMTVVPCGGSLAALAFPDESFSAASLLP